MGTREFLEFRSGVLKKYDKNPQETASTAPVQYGRQNQQEGGRPSSGISAFLEDRNRILGKYNQEYVDQENKSAKNWADRYNRVMDRVQSYRPGDGDLYLKDIQRLIGDYNGIRSYTDGGLRDYWKNLLDLQKVIYDTEHLRGQFDSEEAYNKYVSEQKDYESKRTADLSQLEQEIAKLEKQYREGKTVSDQYQSLYEGTPWLKRKQNPDEYEALRKKGSAYLRDEITNKKSFLNEARAIQERERLEGKYGGKSYQEIQDLLGALDPAGQEAQWARAYAETVMRPEDYSDQILKNTAELKYLEEGLQKIQGLSDQMAMGGETEADKEKYEALLRQYGSPQDLKNQIEALNKENWKYQNALKYGSLNENEDYRALSTQVSDVKKAGIGIGFGTKWWGQGDPVYRYINNIDGAREVVQKGKTPYSVYDFMTDEDIANYNYLYNAQGKKAAQEYLDYLSYDLEHRQQKKLRENAYDLATDHPYTASALSVLTNLGSGIGALDVAGQNLVREISGEYKPIHYERGSMAPTAFTTTIRGTVAQNIADATGIIELDEEGHPFWSRVLNGKSLGDVYQLGMSMVDSTAVAALAWAGIPGGTALLGGSAASQGVLDALEKGASDSQALSMGILNGTFEMLFEEVSLDKLLKGSTGSIIKDILQQGGVEGSEEFLTTLANTAADILVMADKSGYQSDIERYMREDGLDRKQATLKALQNVAIGMGWDFVGGFLSGGAMGGMAMPIHTYVQGASLQKAGVSAEELSQLGETFYQDSKTGKMVGKAGNDSGAFNMGRLYNRISTELSNQNAADIQKALEEKGMDRSIAKKHAQILETIAEGGILSDTQMRMIEKNEILSQAMEEIIRNPDSTVNQRLRGYKDIVHKQQDIYDQEHGSGTEQTHPGQENASKPAEGSIHNLEGKEIRAEVAEDGKTRIISTGETLGIDRIADIRDGVITFQMDDGSYVEASDIAYGSEGEAILYDTAASLGVDAMAADVLAQGFYTSKDISAETYAKGMADAFRYGKLGATRQMMEEGEFTSRLTELQRQNAYEVGRMAARLEKKQTNMEGTVNETKEAGAGVYLRQGVQRDYGSDSGGQVRAVEAAAGGVQNRQGEAQGRSGNGGGAQKAAAGRVSAADLGVPGGSQKKSLSLVPEIEKSPALERARAVAKENGMDIVLFRGGNLEAVSEGGKAFSSRAFVKGDTMYVRADHKDFAPEQLARHEAGHKQIERGEISPKQVYDKLASIYSDTIEELLPDGTTVTKSQCIDYMIEQYTIAYQLTDMTSEEVWEEIVCDSLADMNAFSPETARQAIYFLADIRQEAQKQRAETKAQRTGPPDIVKYSIDPAYAAEIDMWDKNGRPDGEMFVLGSTGGVLQGLGAMEQDIFLRSEKVNTIMREHPEMTLEEIRRIPEILDDPTLVLKSQGKKSKGNNSRLVMFGSVYTQAKQPVLSVLDLHPMENGISIDDMQKVSSSYVKTSHPDTFVQTSDVLYADKKRTIQLLRSIGLTISSRELLPDGYIGNITYSGKKVNINGIPFREAFSGKYGSRFSRDNPTAAELQRENTLLRQRLEYWTGQTKLTERKTVRLADVDKVAKDTLAKYQSEADFGKVRNAMKYLADDMRNLDTASITGFDMDALSSEDSFADMRESPVWDKLQARAEGIAETILDGSKVQTNEEATGFVKDLRDFLKGRKISLEKNKSDISDYNDFRKRNFGRFTLSDSGTPMDTMWMELQEQFGKGFFPEDITHPADQALYVERWLNTAPEYSNPYQADFRDNAVVLANEILDDLFSDAVRDTAPTFADRQAQKLTLEQTKRAMADERLKKTVQEMDEKIQKSRNTIEKLRKEKNQMRKEYQDSRAKSVEGRKKTVLRNQIKDMAKEFHQMAMAPAKANSRHAPIRMTNALYQFCDIFAESQERGLQNQLDALEKRSLAAEGKLQKGGLSEKSIDRLGHEKEVIAKKNARIAEYSKKLRAMREAYADLKGDVANGICYDEHTAKLVEQLQTELSGKDIMDMSRQELEQVKNTMLAMKHTIVHANNLDSMGKNMGLVETVKKFSQNMDQVAAPHDKLSTALREYMIKQMSPDVFFDYICGFAKGNAGKDIQGGFVDGQRRMLGVQRDFYNNFRHLTESENQQERREIRQLMANPMKNMVSIGMKDRTGQGVKLSRGMMMQVYMLLCQEDSLESISRGGLKLPKAEEYYSGKIDRAYSNLETDALYSSEGASLFEMNQERKHLENDLKAEGLEESVRADMEKQLKALEENMDALAAGEKARLLAMRDTIWNQLTPVEKKFIEAARKWYAYSGKLMGNVFESMYGYRTNLVDNYVPIHRDMDSVKLDMRVVDGEINLENAGFTKERVKSYAPILLTDFFSELGRQSDAISRYYGFAQVQKDFNRIWNMQIPGSSYTIKGKVSAKFGQGKGILRTSGSDYVENYIESVSGADHGDNVLNSFYGRAASATLSLNPRVAFSQLASIPTAAAEVGWKNMAIGFGRGLGTSLSTKKKNELAQKSVYFFQRYRGEGGITEIADLKAYGGLWEKVSGSKVGKYLFNWCQNFDVFATASMWSMAEEQVKSSGIKPGSEGYQAAVEQVYENIIRKTQPNYTVTERSDILRDKRGGMKLLTMYKTQSNQNLNILMVANGEFKRMRQDYKNRRNGVTKADFTDSGKRLANAITAVTLGGAMSFVALRTLINFVTGAVNGYRDDDTDEVTKEETMKAMGREMLSSLAGMFTLGSEIYDLVESLVLKEKYYGITDSALSLISNAVEKSVDFVNTLTDSDADMEKKLSAAGKDVEALLNFFGAPASNARKLGEAALMWVRDISSGEFFQYSREKTTDNQYRARFLKAFREGDMEKCGDVVAYLLAKSDEPNDRRAEKKLQSGFQSYMENQFLDEKVTEQEVRDILHGYLDMDPEDVDAALNRWKGELETGKTESDMEDDYLRKTISGEEYMEYLQTYSGKSQEQAESAELKLRCERDEGIAYSEIKELYMDGELSGDRASALMAAYDEEVSQADAKSKVLEWDFESAYGIAYSDRKRAFLDGEISKTELLTGLRKYGGYDQEDAEEYVEKLEFEAKHGFAYAEKKSAYLKGDVTRASLKSILIKEMEYSEEDAELTMQAYDWQKANPGSKYDTTSIKSYLKPLDDLDYSAKACGIPVDTFVKGKAYVGTLHGEKNSKGKWIPNSRINKAFPYIDNLPLSPEQKTAFAVACGWSLKTVKRNKLW